MYCLSLYSHSFQNLNLMFVILVSLHIPSLAISQLWIFYYVQNSLLCLQYQTCLLTYSATGDRSLNLLIANLNISVSSHSSTSNTKAIVLFIQSLGILYLINYVTSTRYIIMLLCIICMCIHNRCPWMFHYVHGIQKTTCRYRFFPSTLLIPGFEHRLSVCHHVSLHVKQSC